MSRNASGHDREPEDLDVLASGLVEQEDRERRTRAARRRRRCASCSQRVIEQGAVRVDQLEDLGRGDRIAVVGEVEQRTSTLLCRSATASMPAVPGDDEEAVEPRLALADHRARRSGPLAAVAPVAAATAAWATSGTTGHRETWRLVDLAAQVEDGEPGMAPSPSRIRQMACVDIPDASRIEAMSGPTTSPAPCIANTRPTIRPRDRLPEYSLMMVADTG